MQLVVKISEDTFFDLKKKQNRTEVDNAVLNGTPLPKGCDIQRIIPKRVDVQKWMPTECPNPNCNRELSTH